MHNFIETIQRHRKEAISLLCYLFLSYLLFDQVIPYVLFCLLQILLFCILIMKREKAILGCQKRISAYSFFASFLDHLISQESVQSSYEASLCYLISYQESIPFVELSLERCPALYEYQAYFLSILEKDRENQAMLLHYESLSESVEQKISDMEKDKKVTPILLLSSIGVFLLGLLKETLSIDSKDGILPLLLFLVLSLPYPVLLLIQTSKARRISDAIEN